MQIPDLHALMTTPEKLCPELQLHVCDGALGKMIHHPLVIHIMFDPDRCGMINAQYYHKTTALEKHLQEGNITSAIFLHERPYRFEALTEYITDYDFDRHPDFWKTVGHVWTDSENIYESFEDWQWIWDSIAVNRESAMSNEEQAEFAVLPDTLVIYRGVEPQGTELGMSWTTDRDKAVWFARRFNGRGKVLKTEIAKSSALAYFTGRGESEIVVLPDMLGSVEEEST